MGQRITSAVSFYCRESKADRNGFAPIEAAMVINGKRSCINLPRKEKPGVFKRALNRKGESELKEWCDLMRSKIYQAQTDMLRRGFPVTAGVLKEYLKNGGQKAFYVDGLIEEYMRILMSRADVSKDTVQKYQLVFDDFRA